MKLSIQYTNEYNQKFCFTHAVEITMNANGYEHINPEVVESSDKVECLICSSKISVDDVLSR